jgi:hypothetical protein
LEDAIEHFPSGSSAATIAIERQCISHEDEIFVMAGPKDKYLARAEGCQTAEKVPLL